MVNCHYYWQSQGCPATLSLSRLAELRRVGRFRGYGVKGLRMRIEFWMFDFSPRLRGVFGGAIKFGRLNRRIRDDAPYR